MPSNNNWIATYSVMAIEPVFTNQDLLGLEQVIEKELLHRSTRVAFYIGEMLIAHAKTSTGFTDQTGNLRSSIGYMVFAKGQLKGDNYISHLGAQDGMEQGKLLAMELGLPINGDVVLVVTAGMKYAIHVESKGYNVLTATEQYSKQVVNTLLKQLTK